MKKIKISADLERRIRGRGDKIGFDHFSDLLDEIEVLLNEKPVARTHNGLSYSQIVGAMSAGLPGRLAYPEKPHVSWIIRQVNKVKELGLAELQLTELAAAAGNLYNRGPVELEFILRMATRILHSVRSHPSPDERDSGNVRVVTGRPEDY